MTELRSSQDSSSPSTLDDDALTQVYGKDKRGRTHGVGLVSRTKLKIILLIRLEIEKVVKQSNVQIEQDMHEIKNSFNLLLRAYYEDQNFLPNNFHSNL